MLQPRGLSQQGTGWHQGRLLLLLLLLLEYLTRQQQQQRQLRMP
jgi:hypothetical protein